MIVDITPEQLQYLKFLEAHKIKEEKVFLSQNQAYKRFGWSNIERWVNQQKIKRYKRPSNVEYKMAEILKAAENRQDY